MGDFLAAHYKGTFRAENNTLFFSLLAAAASLGSYALYHRHSSCSRSKSEDVADEKKKREHVLYALANRVKARDEVHHKVLENCKASDSTFDDAYIYMDAHDLQELVRNDPSGDMSYQRIVRDRIIRSRFIGSQLLNAVTEELYDESFEQAAKITKNSAVGNNTLAGIPISIKDCFEQKGTDSTCGSASRAFKPYTDDGLLVKSIRMAQGLPFVRSNVPQLLMMPESENSLWGRTNNPWDITRNPGGSSGGEAALVASGCSVLGLGSDIGGSIRIPAHFCGLAGFRPTPRRLSRDGSVVPRKDNVSGQMVIEATAGPIARSVRDCVAMMDAMLAPEVIRLETEQMLQPLNKNICSNGIGRKLKIAYFTDDGWFTPVTSCKRAVLESVEALRKRGHEVVPFTLESFGLDVYITYIALMGADGNWHSFMKALDGESLHETYKSLYMFTQLPNFLRPVISYFMTLLGEGRKAKMLLSQRNGGLQAREYYERIVDKALLERKFKAAFADNKFDAIVFPALGIPSPKHGDIGNLLPALSYSMLANLLHWPAGVVPVTRIADGEDDYDIASLNKQQQDSVAKLTKETMKGSKGLPIGVQVMTRKWQDELCLYVMAEIEREIPFAHRPQLNAV